MNLNNLLGFHIAVNGLKQTRRYSSSLRGIGDSSADHSWKLALLVLDCSPEFGCGIDVLKAMKIALIHDICEFEMECDVDATDIITGRRTVEEKETLELGAMCFLRDSFSRDDVFMIWREYVEQSSTEAGFVKVLDKIESLIHLRCTGGCAQSSDDVYSEISYAAKTLAAYPKLTPLFFAVASELLGMYEERGINVSYTRNFLERCVASF